MVSRPYINKWGRLILAKGQKNLIRKQNGQGLGVLLIPLARATLSVFGSGKKRQKKKKKWQEETELLW